MFVFTYSRSHLLTFLQFTIVHASIITYFSASQTVSQVPIIAPIYIYIQRFSCVEASQSLTIIGNRNRLAHLMHIN
ncbi:hypothetical protein BDR07DRAFT_1422051, partial [Suillus spraguei]